MQEWTKEQLIETVEDAKAGDEFAINDLTRIYGKKLYFYARSHANNDADAQDILQNAWIKIINNIESLNDNSMFLSWAHRIIKNVSADFYSSKVKKNSVLFSDLGDTEEGLEYDPEDERISSRPDLVMSEKDRRDIILEVLDSLTEDQRMVIVMHFYDEMSLDAISQKLNVPMSTAQGRYQKAKNAIKEKVSNIQKRDGLRLYGLPPFSYFIYLLSFEKPDAAASAAADTLSAAGADAATAIPANTETATTITGTSVSAGAAAKTAASFWTAEKIIGGIAITATLSAYPVYSVVSNSISTVTVDVSRYMDVKVEGTNGTGSVSVSFEDTGDEELNKFLSEGECSVTDNGILENGLTVTIACTYDLDEAKSKGYKLSNTERSVVITGLTNLHAFDLFNGVSVVWNVNAEEHTAGIQLIVPENPPADITYTVTSNDDNGNVIVHASVDPQELAAAGYEAAGGQYDKTYSLGLEPETYPIERAQCLNSGNEWNKTTHTCSVPQVNQRIEVNISDTERARVRTLAQSYVGRTGTSEEIAHQFINELYGVDTTNMKNTYYVDDPMIGDFILFYDEDAICRRTAVYIGNGQMLSGDYNDGTAHIANVEGSSYRRYVYYRTIRS